MRFKKSLILAPILLFSTSTLIEAQQPTPIVPVDPIAFKPVYETNPVLVTPAEPTVTPTKPVIDIPDPSAIIEKKEPVSKPVVSNAGFKLDRNVSWYGPGFYGGKTACGQKYTKTILGVAHKTLPCGTKVTFMWKGVSITVPVIDRGPYVAGRQWDLSGGLCVALHHCFTGKIYYRIGK